LASGQDEPLTVPTEPVRAANLDGSVIVERRDAAIVLAVSGPVDYRTAPSIRQTLLEVLAERPSLVVTDLLNVDFLGSAGLALLAEAAHLGGTPTALRVVAAGPATLRPVQVTGLDNHLALYPTVHDALAAPRSHQLWLSTSRSVPVPVRM
jgi:anti-sigma B factor antagonist